MHNCLIEFDEQYNIYSTSPFLIHLIGQHRAIAGVFLNLSKAFDTLDHQILFINLGHYGIRDVALQWIKSYFSCRQQLVQTNQTCSLIQSIKCGVLQGSILGPLFIFYINDLPKASKLTKLLLLLMTRVFFFFFHSSVR